MTKRNKRSPIRDEESPLSLPGRSCRQRLLNEFGNLAAVVGGCAAVLGSAVALTWNQLFALRPPVWPVWCIAGLAAGVGFWYARRCKKRMENVGLGLDGEIYVAQVLDRLPAQGYRVFHDLPGHVDPKARRSNRWNIDHVLVGPAGVFVIETKTWRKGVEPGKEQQLHYDGSRLMFDGRHENQWCGEALAQVDGAADRVKALLKETTGRDFPVRPVLVFPGWFVNHVGAAKGSPRWVLNPKVLPGWLANERPRLSSEDVALAVNRVELYSRQRMKDED